MFTPTQINLLARKAHSAEAGSGHTVYVTDTPKRRYVVGGLATRIYPAGEAAARLREGAYAMAASIAGTLADTLGYWEDGGSVYLDLGDMWDSLDIALDMARKRGELAIYDRETGQCIYLACPTPVACEDGCDHLTAHDFHGHLSTRRTVTCI